MRQRTSRPSARVSVSRTSSAARHSASAPVAAVRACRVRTAGCGRKASRSGGVSSMLVWRRTYPAGGTRPRQARRFGAPVRRVAGPLVRALQHKTEAYWFYRVLSLVYDRWVNPLFWTPAMRAAALAHGALDAPDVRVVNVGAGTGFTTEGIVRAVPAERVTMVDQSPHQLARARAKPALTICPKLLGDAEALPFPDDRFDRYVSAGSIEYWPDPQRGVAEAYRVLRAGGRALLVGPVRPANPAVRAL